jgi:hypothetical protein
VDGYSLTGEAPQRYESIIDRRSLTFELGDYVAEFVQNVL